MLKRSFREAAMHYQSLSVIESSLSLSLTMHGYTVTLYLPGPLIMISLVPSDSHFSSSIVLAFPGLGKTYSLIHEDLRDCLGVSTRPKQFVNSMVHLTEIRVLCTVPYLSTWPIKAISSCSIPSTTSQGPWTQHYRTFWGIWNHILLENHHLDIRTLHLLKQVVR